MKIDYLVFELIGKARRDKAFSRYHVQRVCGVDFKTAKTVIDRAIESDVLFVSDIYDWLYEFKGELNEMSSKN